MKRRVTLFLEEDTYRILRVMAATEGKSMTEVVEMFLLGERSIVTDEKKIKELTKGYKEDKTKEKVFKKDDPIFTEGNQASVVSSKGNIPFE